MIDLLPPKIDGATDAEKVAQLTDYVNTLYSTLSNKFENIDITDLNYTFAEQHRHLGITGQAGGVYAVNKPEEAPKKQECDCPYKDFDLEAELDFLKVPKEGEIDLSDIYKRFGVDEGDLESLTKSLYVYDMEENNNYAYGDGKLHFYKDKDWANLEGIVKMIKRLYGYNGVNADMNTMHRANLINLATELKSIPKNLPEIKFYGGYVSAGIVNGKEMGLCRYTRVHIGNFVIMVVKVQSLYVGYSLDVKIGSVSEGGEGCSFIIDRKSFEDSEGVYAQITHNENDGLNYLNIRFDGHEGFTEVKDVDIILAGDCVNFGA